jgi:HK97 family phage prohead protease
MIEHRAYSLLTITKADEDRREISGVMSTGETDRVGDQVMPLGVKARLPAPCLWQHDHHDPIGEIVWIEPRPDGIRFRAKLARVDGPPALKDKLDGYFALIKAGVVKGISIGFRALQAEPIATGLRFNSWELLEASVVTIPANASCTIQTVKALDAAARQGELPALDGSLWREVANAGQRAMDELRSGPGYQKASSASRMAGEARVCGMEMAKALASRIESFELQLADGRVEYRGVWSAGQQYRRGHLVTHHGNIWHCDRPTAGKPGEDFASWTLACRKGRDGKDCR